MFLSKGSLVSGDAGHNCSPDRGASKYKVEDTLTKEVWTVVQQGLGKLGYSIKDCTPWNKNFGSVMESLRYRVNVANRSGSKLHLCIHFNAGGGHGVECWISGRGGNAEQYAKQICNKISNLGYRNRGVKVGNLYIPRTTSMPCVLIECAFVDSKEDMDRYNASAIGNAIVEAITGVNSGVDNVAAPINSNPITPGVDKVPETKNEAIGYLSKFSYDNNTKISGDFMYVRDANGNIISDRLVFDGDNITVLYVNYSKQLALVQYPTPNGVRQGYVTNATNIMKYYFEDQYKNGSTSEDIFDEQGNKIGLLYPWEKATPLYRKNGMLHVVYDTKKGRNTKSGYVKYNGGFTKF
ncbi:N-acetylmuramoyl-L-alanine amidase [Clostridium tarantellae]|nr:N-acetylmuramoyl-L-alanine amidase [Clostridium tarantellae]